MKQALHFANNILLKPSAMKMLKLLLEEGEQSGRDILDAKIGSVALDQRMIYYGLIKKRTGTDGRNYYSLSYEGKDITKAAINLINNIHNLVEEPQVKED